MRLTKNQIRRLLKEENYIEALAIFANKILKYKTTEGQENELNRIDSKLWQAAEDGEQQDQALRIYTALIMGIE